ncbi:MAG: conjugal transfer protein TraX [Ruminococcus sp.]|nr:conjugal transfer protein TraX [Ruminococcus sp.]
MTTTALKILALIFMTVDHIGSHIPGMPIWLRWIGRLASPIFFFCAAESTVKTSSRRQYLKRLYRASFITVMAESVVPAFCKRYFGINCGFDNNIFLNIFQGAVIIAILETTKNDPARRKKELLWYVRYQAVLLGLLFLVSRFDPFEAMGININLIPLLDDWERIMFTALGSVWHIEGPLLLLPQMLIFYLFKDNKKQLAAWYTAYCAVYFLIFVPQLGIKTVSFLNGRVPVWLYELVKMLISLPGIPVFPFESAQNFADSLLNMNFQWMMIFSLPFILCYNGKKGRGMKWFFYIYYLLHLIILNIIGALM